jgi:hypothetical protein
MTDKEAGKTADNETVLEKRTGYEPKELLKSPVKPPKNKDKRPPTDKQKSTFITGLFIVLAGLLLFSLVGIYGEAFLVVVGLGVIAYSVLFRIENKEK